MSKKIVGWFVFLLLIMLCVVGSYFFYQYKSKQIVTTLIEQLVPVADISYSDLTVDFEGKVALIGVEFSPVGYQDAVLIDKIDLISGSALSLMSADNWFEGDLPEALELQLSSVIFKVDSDFLHDSNRPLSKTVQQKTLWGMACADSTDFFSLAKQLGLLKLQADVNINISSDPSSRIFKTAMSADVPGLVKGLFAFEIHSVVPFEFYDRSVLSRAKITHASAKITDLGFNLKRIRHCAKKEQIKEKHYPNFYNASVTLNMVGKDISQLPELDESVLAFFKPRSNVSLQLTPKYPLFLPEVFSQSFDLFKAQGLKLAVNKKLVSTTYLPLLKGSAVEVEQKEVVKEDILSEIKAEVVAKEVKLKSKFRSVGFAELVNMKGVKIRLRTNVGKELDGVLLRVEEDKIVMQRRVEQGVVTYPVNKKNIASIKILR